MHGIIAALEWSIFACIDTFKQLAQLKNLNSFWTAMPSYINSNRMVLKHKSKWQPAKNNEQYFTPSLLQEQDLNIMKLRTNFYHQISVADKTRNDVALDNSSKRY